MALKTQPAYIGQAGYLHPVELDRNLVEKLSGGRGGIWRSGDFAVTPTATTRQISIAAGAATLLGVENANQGAYFVYSDAAETKLFGAPSGQPRIDTLLLRVKDDQYGTISGTPEAYFDIVSGVAAASPVARTDADFNTGGSFYIPGAWFRVADVRTNVGDTTIPAGQITHNLRYIRQGHATLIVAGSYPSDPVVGDTVQEIDGDKLRWYYDGSAWRLARPFYRNITLSSTAASATFSGLPTTLKDVEITWTARTNDTGFIGRNLHMTINNNTGANYRFGSVSGNGASASSSATYSGATFAQIGIMTSQAGGNIAGQFGSGKCSIQGWNSPHSNFLGFVYQSQIIISGTGNTWLINGGGEFDNAGPYNRIDLAPEAGSFVSGCQFTIRGWD